MNGFDFRGSKLTIFRVLYPDCLTDATEAVMMFRGYIDSPSYADGVFSCTVKSDFTSVKIPSRSCQLMCNNKFGDEDCTVSKDVRTGVLAEGTTQTAIYYGDGDMKDYWKDGVITIDGESRIIKESTDKVYVNIGFVQQLTPGMTFTIQRGCDMRQKTCIDRFNNAQNFSGFPSIPFESTYR